VIRIPKPDTIQAYLYCDKLRRATLHKYIGTFEVMLPMLPANEGDPAVGGEAWAFIFQCQLTGTKRNWGVEARTPSSFDGHGNEVV